MKENCTVYTKKDFDAFKCEQCTSGDKPCVVLMIGGGDKPQPCLLPEIKTEPKWIEISNISTIIMEN